LQPISSHFTTLEPTVSNPVAGRPGLNSALLKDEMRLSSNDQASELPVVREDAPSSNAARKFLKVLRSPRLAAALLNAQLSMLGKARVPLSVRLFGRICFRSGGHVEFGNGVCLVGNVTPIEIVSYKGSNISIGDHTFINYGTSITAYQQVKIGSHCLLGHHLRIVDRNEHGIEERELAPPAAPVVIDDHVWIGAHVIILPGVRIGRNSAIGAGSVVTKDVPPNSLAVGNPARVLRKI
jgi:acetyltransferase-like isoleucine patch superfamily enzyme